MQAINTSAGARPRRSGRAWKELRARSSARAQTALGRMRQMLQMFSSCSNSCPASRAAEPQPLSSVFTELFVTFYCNYGQTHCKQAFSNWKRALPSDACPRSSRIERHNGKPTWGSLKSTARPPGERTARANRPEVRRSAHSASF